MAVCLLLLGDRLFGDELCVGDLLPLSLLLLLLLNATLPVGGFIFVSHAIQGISGLSQSTEMRLYATVAASFHASPVGDTDESGSNIRY